MAKLLQKSCESKQLCYDKYLKKQSKQENDINDIARTMAPFHFDVFSLKSKDILNQCLVLSITKKIISYWLVLGQQPLIALQKQNFH